MGSAATGGHQTAPFPTAAKHDNFPFTQTTYKETFMTNSFQNRQVQNSVIISPSPSNITGAPDPEERPFTPYKSSQVRDFVAEHLRGFPITEIMTYWRARLDTTRLKQAAAKLGVPETFLLEFRPGWIPELGTIAFETIDAAGEPQGVEIVGVMIPEDTILDRDAVVGLYGHPAPASTVRPGAPLAVGTRFDELYACWCESYNVVWRSSDVVCSKSLTAIERYAERIGSPEFAHLCDAHRSEPMLSMVQAARARILARNQ